jgi:hypothetical protein
MNRKASKANAIRFIGQNQYLTNAEIKCQVHEQFGLSVESSYIVDVLGAFRDRVKLGHRNLVDAAKVFLDQCGSRKVALRVLRLIGGKEND